MAAGIARSCGTLLVLIGASGPAVAQEASDGGPLLSFGVTQRLAYESNPDLDPGGSDAGFVATTGLSFAFSDRTRTESFVLTADTGLRIEPESGAEFATPSIGLVYSRESADAVLSASASWSRAEISRAAVQADFIDETGEIFLPADFNVLEARFDGTRTQTGVGLKFEGGRTRPLGYSLSARLSTITYDGPAATELDDSQTLTLGAGLSFRLDDVTRASLNATYRIYDEDGSDTEGRWGLAARWQRDRPNGGLSFGVGLQETTDGTRLSLDAGRSFEGPRTTLSFGVGLTRPAEGDWTLTGRIDGRYDLPEGAITFAAQRQFATTADGEGQDLTTLSAGITQRLTPLSQIDAGFSFASAEGDTDRVETLQLQAAYNYQITPDWTLSAGVAVSERRETGLARARNESVFLALGREFTIRP